LGIDFLNFMATQVIEKFIDRLTTLLKEPPYKQFVFVGGVLAFVSLILQKWSEQIWVFLLYSVAGTMWRYMERDIRHNVLKSGRMIKISIVIYHIGNVVLFYALLHYLKLI